MKKLIISLLSVCMLAACGSSTKLVDVKFTPADHYFFRIDARIPDSVKITSKAQFESMFDMAAVMGKNGQPTPIDFNKQFVLAKVLPATDVKTQIIPQSLKASKNHTLYFNYQIKKGNKMNYSIKPMLLLIVDRKYVNYKVK